jgi:hypothetical protein
MEPIVKIWQLKKTKPKLGDFGTFVLQKSLYKFIGFSFVANVFF